jgi:hypothetical protein
MGSGKTFKRIAVPAVPVVTAPATVAPAPVTAAAAPSLPEISRDFIFAGRAAFSVSNAQDEHFTFKVRGRDGEWQGRKTRSYFLSIKASGGRFPYRYIGIVNADGTIKSTAKSEFLPNTKEYKIAAWALSAVVNGKLIPAGYHIRHLGKCGRCSRTLSDPQSIERGIGPECWSQMGRK